jgi:uncharacterized protein
MGSGLNVLRCVSDKLTYKLRWSKEREEYISYCNCCPPNTVRTIAEVSNYMYSLSDQGLYINLYSGNELSTNLRDGSVLKLKQETEYPWGEKIKITLVRMPKKEFSIFYGFRGGVNHKILRIKLIPYYAWDNRGHSEMTIWLPLSR